MHKRVRQGFTIVEVATVVFIIAILATITIVVFNNVQSQSRDTKRNNDMAILGSLLEKYYLKNGTYPNGCGTATCTSASPYQYLAPDTITYNTTLSQLSTILSTSSLNTMDPLLQNSQAPIAQADSYNSNSYTDTNFTGYIYVGGKYYSPVTAGNDGVALLHNASSSSQCLVNIQLQSAPSNQSVAAYVLAYFSQADGSWHIFTGKYGDHAYIASGATPGYCVIEN